MVAGRRLSRLRRRFIDSLRLGKMILDVRIAFDSRHVGASRQRRCDLSSPFHQDGINDIKGLMLDVAFAQPFKDWPLGPLGFLPQGLINEAAFFGLGWQVGGRAQVGPVSEHDKKFSLLPVGGVFDHPRRDLVRNVDPVAANSLADSIGRSDSGNERYNSCNKEQ